MKDGSPRSTPARSISLGGLVEHLGGHPAGELGLDLDDARDAGRWLVASCLLAGRGEEADALRAFRGLTEAGLEHPEAIAMAAPERLEAVLAGSGAARPGPLAWLLVRASTALAEAGGSPEALAREAEGFEDLAGRIARLAPGIGKATVLRFLQPFRDRWPAALEAPLTPAARAAAVHLGLLAEGEDAEGEPGGLRAALREIPDGPALTDTEAALDRLGRQACLRNRPARCPLAKACPARGLGPGDGLEKLNS
jgi:hypothetical protein